MELRKSHPFMFWMSVFSGLLYICVGLLDALATEGIIQSFFGFLSIALGGPILISSIRFDPIHRKLMVLSTFYSTLISSLLAIGIILGMLNDRAELFDVNMLKITVLWWLFTGLQYLLSVEPPVNPANWEYDLRIARKADTASEEGAVDE